jgi:hypothetical protein
MATSKEFTPLQTQYLLKRLPPFELSYEIIAHKKVFSSYNLSLAIPSGKKTYIWFSFHKSNDVCYLLDLNREKKVSKISIVDTDFHHSLSLGTLLYGTIIHLDENKSAEKDGRRIFVIEDMFHYKGISMKNMLFGEKLGYIEDFLSKHVNPVFKTSDSIVFSLPVMRGFESTTEEEVIAHYDTYKSTIPYQVHHIQIRKLNDISPYINIPFNNALTKINKPSIVKEKPPTSIIETLSFQMDFSKPQYRYPTVFQVSPDIQYDIYHLYAYESHKKMIYYGVAYIPNIRSSFFMNSLFRKIRENKNIDYIEESDDEDDFENMNEDKYVSLQKTLNMECTFHTKFKKWVPVRVVEPHAKIIHISKLVSDYRG